MRILITGGTGFIGGALIRKLLGAGHQCAVLTRSIPKARGIFGETVEALADLDSVPEEPGFEAIVNLAGAPLLDRPWTRARKKVLWDSRVGLTEHLVAWIGRRQTRPRVLLSGSAVGVYGDGGEQILDEETHVCNRDFGSDLCWSWEEAARLAERHGVRVAIVRTGLVLHRDGGMLKRMLPAFRLGLGGPIGSGRQWMSWIHRDDLIALMQRILESPTLSGIFNGTAPYPVTNAEFTTTLARLLRRPAFFRLPAWLLRSVGGEMGELLLGSQRVIPERALHAGFVFRYPELEPALRSCLGL